MQIIFRCDASSHIGEGHVRRCLNLADALSANGANCQFVSRELHGHINKHISLRGHMIHPLANSKLANTSKLELTHSKWLGTDWETDAVETRAAMGTKYVDWLIVDHYALDYSWETKLRPYARKILVIDDLADRRHDCNIFLNQNFGSSVEQYDNLLPKECKKLFGPQYALLNPTYAKQRNKMGPRNGQIKRVLIYFGSGEDAIDLTISAIQIFKDVEIKNIAIDVVVGVTQSTNFQFKSVMKEFKNIKIHSDLPDLADLMVKADLAIGAGGSTTYERCCMGLPTLLFVAALNQEKLSKALENMGAAFIFYTKKKLLAEMKKIIIMLMNDSNQYFEINTNAASLCDGLGVSRVCKEIFHEEL